MDERVGVLADELGPGIIISSSVAGGPFPKVTVIGMVPRGWSEGTAMSKVLPLNVMKP